MKKKRGNIDGARPLDTKTEEEELTNHKSGKDSPQREVNGMTYASK
jgi:hypothetical protein